MESIVVAELGARCRPGVGCCVPSEPPSGEISHFLLLTLLNFSYINVNVGKPILQAREKALVCCGRKDF